VVPAAQAAYRRSTPSVGKKQYPLDHNVTPAPKRRRGALYCARLESAPDRIRHNQSAALPLFARPD
jgi:hypothetical protein